MTTFAQRSAGPPATIPAAAVAAPTRAEIGKRIIDRGERMHRLELQLNALRADQMADIRQLLDASPAAPAWRPADSLDQETADRPRVHYYTTCHGCGHLRPAESHVCDTYGCDGVGPDGGEEPRTIDLSTSQLPRQGR
jgi:hypothetical protein